MFNAYDNNTRYATCTRQKLVCGKLDAMKEVRGKMVEAKRKQRNGSSINLNVTLRYCEYVTLIIY